MLAKDIGSVSAVRFSPDEKTVAAAVGHKVMLWNVAGDHRLTLIGHSAGVKSIVFWPNGKTLASCSGDGTVKLWDLESGDERFTFRDPEGSISVNWLALSPDGKVLALCNRDGTIRLLRAATDEEVRAVGW